MNIPFTQYLRPDGRPRSVSIDRPKEIAARAAQIISGGYRLECEVLTSGEISLTIGDDEEDCASELCNNGPDVPAAVDRLIMGFRAEGLLK